MRRKAQGASYPSCRRNSNDHRSQIDATILCCFLRRVRLGPQLAEAQRVASVPRSAVLQAVGQDLRQRGRLESDLALTQPVAVTLATLEVEDLESDLAS